jgi:hypothetical protein
MIKPMKRKGVAPGRSATLRVGSIPIARSTLNLDS